MNAIRPKSITHALVTDRVATYAPTRLAEALEFAQSDLVTGAPSKLTPDQARTLNLAPWCYHASAPDSLHRRVLATDFSRAWHLQMARDRALADLFTAWDAAGVRWAAFKGWAFALTVYPHPALRYSGDVDLIVDPDQATLARRHVPSDWHLVEPHLPTCDIAMYLIHSRLGLLVEVHHSLVPNLMMGEHHSRRITQAMLDDSRPRPTSAGCALPTLRTLQPSDLVLSLVMNRSWSADAWRPKVHDYLDLLNARLHAGVEAEHVAKRAAELRVARTWKRFLLRCDPYRSHLDLLTPRLHPTRHAWLNEFAIWPDKASPRLRALSRRAGRAPGVLARALRVLPTLLGVLRDLRRQTSPQAVAAQPAGPPMASIPPWQAQQAVAWCCRLSRAGRNILPAGPCVIESLTLFRALQRMGHEADWVLGHRPEPGQAPVGHAWVECQDRYALGLDAPARHSVYVQAYRQRGQPSRPSP